MPLGGLGRVGGNIMVFETERDLIVVDCGILFPNDDELGVDFVLPDVSYVERKAHKLRGYVITHAHEDHIGALPYILPGLPAPVYGTAFTLAHFRMKLVDHPELEPELVTIRDHEEFALGGFEILPIPVTHSIVGAVALALRTPIGRVIHTGDFRIDPAPPDGRLTDERELTRLGDEGVALLLSDSTNSTREGNTQSEALVKDNLAALIAEAEHRVMVTTFSSNLHRLRSVIEASHEAQRTVLPVGRSMSQTIQMAMENGFLDVPRGAIADVSNFADFTRSQVTLLVSGSQGEPRGSFSRIAEDTHGWVALEPDDTVLLSSRKIPGNELRIGRAINSLYRRGIRVLDDRTAPIHTSGHAYQGEQRRMIEWTRPEWFIPIHGEYRHMVHHARTAADSGVRKNRIFITEDGEPITFERTPGGIRAWRDTEVEAGPVYIGGSAVGMIDDVVLRDRQLLQQCGIIFCVVVIDEDDQIVAGPDIGTRGVFHVADNPRMVEDAVDAVLSAWERVQDAPEDLDGWGRVVKGALKRFFKRDYDLRPLLVPMVLRAD